MTLQEMVFNVGVNKYLEKRASILGRITGKAGKAAPWHAAAEVAGLGTLASIPAAHLMGKPMGEDTASKVDLAGLGVLAAPSVHDIWKHVRRVK